MEHTTYNMMFALIALEEGFTVCVAHPDDDEVQMFTPEDIEDSEGHLFVIREAVKEWKK